MLWEVCLKFQWKMICWISTWLSFLVLLVNFSVPFLLDVSSFHQARLKLTLMELLGDILVLLLMEVFFVGVWGSLLVLSLHFLKFRLLWLMNFMKLYILWRKLKKRGLQMVYIVFIAKTNVRWMFRNQWNNYLNYCGKIKLVTHISREENVCAVSWLIKDLFI